MSEQNDEEIKKANLNYLREVKKHKIKYYELKDFEKMLSNQPDAQLLQAELRKFLAHPISDIKIEIWGNPLMFALYISFKDCYWGRLIWHWIPSKENEPVLEIQRCYP